MRGAARLDEHQQRQRRGRRHRHCGLHSPGRARELPAGWLLKMSMVDLELIFGLDSIAGKVKKSMFAPACEET